MSLQRQLERKLGRGQQRAAGELGFDCPRCGPNSEKYHLGVNLKKCVFNCFRCKYGGHLSKILKDYDFKSADLVSAAIKRPVLGVKPKGFKLINKKIWMKNRPLRRFLKSRGIFRLRAQKLGMGVVEKGNWTDIKRFAGRVIIPVIENGEWVYWVARAYDKELEKKEISPRKDEMNVRRSDVIHGIDDVTPEHLVICEGIFDAERIRRYGINAVALLGSNFSDVQCGKLLAKKAERVDLMLDGDVAGRTGALKALKMLFTRARRLNARIIHLPDGIDPDKLKDDELCDLLM